jgi:hypothetical protein
LRSAWRQRRSVRHAGEDVVGRAVDDRADRRDPVRQEVAAQRRDERDPAAHARFEHDVEPAAWRFSEQLRAGLRHQFLVRGDHVLARLPGPADERAGRLFAADDSPHDVDRRVVDDIVDVGGQQRPGRQVDVRGFERSRTAARRTTNDAPTWRAK